MATENWYSISGAIASVPYDQWTNNGGANKNASTRVGGGRAGPVTHDDDTTYINEITAGQRQSLNVDWPEAFNQGGQYNSIFTANLRYRAANAADRVQGSFTNSGGTGGTAWADSTGAVPYTDVGPTDVSNAASYRPTGGTWLTSDFQDSTTIFSDVIFISGLNSPLVTSIWGSIGFEMPAGGFAFMLGLVGLMSLQLAGPMCDYTQFEKFLQWRQDYHPRHTIMSDQEKITAWDEYKSYKAPRFFYG